MTKEKISILDIYPCQCKYCKNKREEIIIPDWAARRWYYSEELYNNTNSDNNNKKKIPWWSVWGWYWPEIMEKFT